MQNWVGKGGGAGHAWGVGGSNRGVGVEDPKHVMKYMKQRGGAGCWQTVQAGRQAVRRGVQYARARRGGVQAGGVGGRRNEPKRSWLRKPSIQGADWGWAGAVGVPGGSSCRAGGPCQGVRGRGALLPEATAVQEASGWLPGK